MKNEFVKSDRIKIEILKALKESEKPLTYYQLTKETRTTWNSLVPNCNFLNRLGFIKITEGETPGMKFKSIQITRKGINSLSKLVE
jgi:DNA-binding PadR family transcriptional regulator